MDWTGGGVQMGCQRGARRTRLPSYIIVAQRKPGWSAHGLVDALLTFEGTTVIRAPELAAAPAAGDWKRTPLAGKLVITNHVAPPRWLMPRNVMAVGSCQAPPPVTRGIGAHGQ